jgi:LemA protein
MSKTKIILLTVFAVLIMTGVSLFSWVTGSYNSMVSQRETVSTTWSEVETQYQRRYDLIPNLASATKGYMAHEQTVFKDIADARTKYAGAPSGTEAKTEAASGLEGALARLLIVMENYPNLKADATVKGLMDELAGTENRVTVARSRYNEAARDYNIDIKKFPRNFLASAFNFDEKLLFTVQTEEAKTAPKVDLEVK